MKVWSLFRFDMQKLVIAILIMVASSNSLLAVEKSDRFAQAVPPLRLKLRGGWLSEFLGNKQVRKGIKEPVQGDVVVKRKVLDVKSNKWKDTPNTEWPGEFHHVVDTVPEAVEDALDANFSRVFVGSGMHSWDGNRLVVGGWRADEQQPSEGSYAAGNATYFFNLTGDAQARMWGMWVLEGHAFGCFEGVTLAFKTGHGLRSTLEVWDGPWGFNHCDLRCTGGIALKTGRRAMVSCVASGIGGLEAGEKDEFGDWVGTEDLVSGHEQRANIGVQMFDLSDVTLEKCTIEFTGLVGAGVRMMHETKAVLNSCEFYANSVAVYVDDDASVTVADSTFIENDMGAFYAGVASCNATMLLRNNTIHGKLWFHKRRPGNLLENHFVGAGGPTHTNESFSDLMERLALEAKDGLDYEVDPPHGEFPENDLPRCSVGRLAKLYGIVRLEREGTLDPVEDPDNTQFAQRVMPRVSEHEKELLKTSDGVGQLMKRWSMQSEVAIAQLLEEEDSNDVQDDSDGGFSSSGDSDEEGGDEYEDDE